MVKYKLFLSFKYIFAALLFLAMTTTQLLSAPAEVTSVRIGGDNTNTRFVLDVNGTTAFRAFSLANPNRIVIDLDEVSWKIGPGGAKGKALINNYRYGLYMPGTSRLVLDLKSPVKITNAFTIKGKDNKPNRLVFDFTKVSQADFTKNISKPKAAAVASRSSREVISKSSGKKTIVLDPGHGGHDPGNLGGVKVNGISEKNVTISAAKNIKKILEASGRYNVIMTRDRDIFLKLRERSLVAHRNNADLFISIHADAFRSSTVRGATIYTLTEKASDREAAILAARENKSDIIAGVDLEDEPDLVQNILIDLVKQETMNLSNRFAGELAPELKKAIMVRKRSLRSAGFAVLKGIDVPSVLIEMGYLTNRTDATLLMQKETHDKIGNAILRATDKYFQKNFAFN
ncbi:MAG: N-acetylmuramoyl-L-alanine amidase [Kordiimonadaceae bacterium]|jgi:N-acetylmuramoyl-L-alanine amidase|nr:N-acetylmuramoyl-L-alanine amidase [Kordiimonadaceae bacterium]MBT6033869.1 N-acetylmuramoyl-L-alanine amidase [Kordiimonadaceae bacterium]